METYHTIEGWSSSHVRYILYQIICAFHYLNVVLFLFIHRQSANIMHRDVKPSNILMDTQCGIHVIDFGLARRISPAHHAPRSNSATISVASTLSADTVMDPALETAQEPAPRPTIERPVLQRQLTRHVATRWYRAPEIIILEVDAWCYRDVETLLLRCGHVVDRLHLRSLTRRGLTYRRSCCRPSSPGFGSRRRCSPGAPASL